MTILLRIVGGKTKPACAGGVQPGIVTSLPVTSLIRIILKLNSQSILLLNAWGLRKKENNIIL